MVIAGAPRSQMLVISWLRSFLTTAFKQLKANSMGLNMDEYGGNLRMACCSSRYIRTLVYGSVVQNDSRPKLLTNNLAEVVKEIVKNCHSHRSYMQFAVMQPTHSRYGHDDAEVSATTAAHLTNRSFTNLRMSTGSSLEEIKTCVVHVVKDWIDTFRQKPFGICSSCSLGYIAVPLSRCVFKFFCGD